MEETRLKDLKRRFENLNLTLKKQQKKSAMNWDKIFKEIEEQIDANKNTNELDALTDTVNKQINQLTEQASSQKKMEAEMNKKLKSISEDFQ